MRDRELLGKPIDVIEIAVGLVLVFLVELLNIELLVVEASMLLGRLRLSGRLDVSSFSSICGRLLVEGAASSGSSSSLLLGGCPLGVVVSSFGLLRVGRCSQVLGHPGSSPGSGRMGTHLDGGTRRGHNPLVLVNPVDVDVTRDAGVAGDNFLGANVEGGAHDGAFCGALGEGGEGREAGGGAGGEVAQSRGFGPAQVGAGLLEAGEGLELVHGGMRKGMQNMESHVGPFNTSARTIPGVQSENTHLLSPDPIIQ